MTATVRRTVRRRNGDPAKVRTREEWLEARNALLEREKELTRRDEGDPPEVWFRRHDEC
jgi:predicted dithiol-disulfide oxidoreductase (DUF899 family)